MTTQVHRHTCRAREALTGIFKPGRQRAHTPVPARRPRRRHRCEGTKAPEATERKTSRETETVTCGVTTQHALFTPSLVPTSASLLTLLDTQDVLEVPRGGEKRKERGRVTAARVAAAEWDKSQVGRPPAPSAKRPLFSLTLPLRMAPSSKVRPHPAQREGGGGKGVLNRYKYRREPLPSSSLLIFVDRFATGTPKYSRVGSGSFRCAVARASSRNLSATLCSPLGTSTRMKDGWTDVRPLEAPARATSGGRYNERDDFLPS